MTHLTSKCTNQTTGTTVHVYKSFHLVSIVFLPSLCLISFSEEVVFIASIQLIQTGKDWISVFRLILLSYTSKNSQHAKFPTD